MIRQKMCHSQAIRLGGLADFSDPRDYAYMLLYSTLSNDKKL